jgi:hypothetical protein
VNFTLRLASHIFILPLLLCRRCNNISEILLEDKKYLVIFLIGHWKNRRRIGSGINSDVKALRKANRRSFIILTFNGVLLGKVRWISWIGHVACVEEIMNAYRFWSIEGRMGKWRQ